MPDHHDKAGRADSGISSEFAFPYIVIDFEATALTLTSYPIEVGIAKAADPTSEIEVWSSLIAPAPYWNLAQEWDPDAERVHGISRWDLRSGSSAADVMCQLNELVGAGTVWCDGGHYDFAWLNRLADAAGIEPTFALDDIDALVGSALKFKERFHDILRRSRAPHRAGPDAERICAALIAALNVAAGK